MEKITLEDLRLTTDHALGYLKYIEDFPGVGLEYIDSCDLWYITSTDLTGAIGLSRARKGKKSTWSGPDVWFTYRPEHIITMWSSCWLLTLKDLGTGRLSVVSIDFAGPLSESKDRENIVREDLKNLGLDVVWGIS